MGLKNQQTVMWSVLPMLGALAVLSLAFSGCKKDKDKDDTGGGILDGSVDDGSVTYACGGNDCNILDGSGCSTGYACYFVTPTGGGEPTATCEPDGVGTDGTTCTADTDCAPGFGCDMASNPKVCRAYCCSASDECPSGQACAISLEGPSGATGVGLCSASDECDLVAQDCTGTGNGCYPTGSGNSVLCVSGGSTAVGNACTNANDCVPGATCNGGTGTCQTLCTFGDADGCGTGNPCNVLLTGFTDVGLCT